MKKVFATLMLLCVVGSLTAQNRWGVIGGANVSTTSTDNYKWKFGGYVGGLYDIGLSESFYLQPQLIFSYEENEAKNVNTVLGYTPKRSQFALTLPVLASYKIALQDNTSLRIQAGPYLQYALCGQERQGRLVDAGKSSSEMGWWHESFGDHFTYGLKGGVALELNHYLISADCKYSLRKSPLNFDGHGLTVSFGIGYIF